MLLFGDRLRFWVGFVGRVSDLTVVVVDCVLFVYVVLSGFGGRLTGNQCGD